MRKLATALAVTLVFAACRTVPLHQFPEIGGSQRAELNAIAIRRSLELQGFAIEEDVPGRIRAKVAHKNWLFRIDVNYSTSVKIDYVDSTNCSFEMRDGRPYIHENYNIRVKRLSDAIGRETQRVLADYNPDEALGPPVSAPAPPPPADPAP